MAAEADTEPLERRLAAGETDVEYSKKDASEEGVQDNHDDDKENDSDSTVQGEEAEEDGDDEIRTHKSYEQVMLDVNRCAGRLEHIKNIYLHRRDDDEPPEDLTEELELQRLAGETGSATERPRKDGLNATAGVADDQEDRRGSPFRLAEQAQHDQRELKRKLAKLIVKLLIKKPDLHYYQGFHDVCLTYMTLFGDRDAYYKLDQLVDSHFRIFMQPTMNETQDFLALIPIIIGLHDSKVREFLEKAEVGTIFALSWVITWFSHVIPSQRDVEKIFEFLARKDPHMVLYLCAMIVMHKRERLLELEAEMSTVHHFLCQVPRKEMLPIDRLLNDATRAFDRWPPDVIRQKLDVYRRTKLQLHNYNIVTRFASRLGPTVSNIVTSNTRTALIVIVLASALALQFDRWIR